MTYTWNLKNKTNKTKQKKTDKNREQTDSCQRRDVGCVCVKKVKENERYKLLL